VTYSTTYNIYIYIDKFHSKLVYVGARSGSSQLSSLIMLFACPLINTFTEVASYFLQKASSFMTSIPAVSFGDRFCMSRRGGTGEVGGFTQRSMSGLGLETPQSALGGTFLSSYAQMG